MNKKFFSVILLGAMLVTSMGTFTACKDYDGDISNVQSQVDANKKAVDEKIAALQAAATQATKDIADAKAQAVAAKTAADAAAAAAAKANTAAEKAAADAAAAKAAADAAKAAGLEAAATAKADAIAEAQKLVNALKLTVDGKVDQTVFDTKMKDITAKLNAITGRLEKAEEAIEAYKLQIAALERYKEELEKLGLTEKVGKIDQLVADMENLIKKGGTIDVIKEDITKINDRITKEINPAISTLDQVISGRLTSLTFVPSTFISGIEAVEFKSLTYKPWTKLLANETDGTTDITINDGSTTAYYYVNPSSVKVDDLKKLSTLVNIATNTKADAPAQIEAKFKSYENGKLAVSLTKTSAASLNFAAPAVGTEKFNLMALKADIKLTAQETAAGLKPTVVSDWARLTESAVTPRIHNVNYTTCPAQDFATGLIPHFYTYGYVHPKAIGVDQENSGKGILKSIAYNDHTTDLDDLVQVCDNAGKIITNFADYNLKFEFALVEYGLKTSAGAVEITDQAKFAHIDANNIIHSNAYGNVDLTDNRDAVGREPLVQVVLKDTKNNKVVDVRYFKVRWVLVTETKDLGILNTLEKTFDCTNPLKGNVGTEFMNVKVYTAMNMSKEEFHKSFDLDTKAYPTLEDAKAGTNVANWADLVELNSGSGAATTHNIEWTVNLTNKKITAAEYAAKVAKRDVYGRYIAKDGSGSVLLFKLATNVNIPQMAFAAGYDQGYWNVSVAELSNTNPAKEFRVNPSLTTDPTYGTGKGFTDCRLIASMLKGYNKTGVVLSKPLELVSGAKQARLEFNKEALSVLPVVSGKIWKVENDATASKLILGTEIAAVITFADNTIELYEGATPGKTGAPTAEAQLLLGKIVPVRLVAGLCDNSDFQDNIEVVLDRFNVRFISPLKLNIADFTGGFKDLITSGSTVDIKDIASIQETFGLQRMVWKNGAEATVGLVDWYIVEGVMWDLDKAKTNLKEEGGNIVITSDNFASDFKNFKAKYSITADVAVNATKLTFINNSGASIQQAFTISVPVYAKTKWSPMLVSKTAEYVTFTVQPGTVTSPAPRR